MIRISFSALLGWVVGLGCAFSADAQQVVLEPLGNYNPYGVGVDVAVEGQFAYVAMQQGGLKVFDISDPEHPRWVGAHATPGLANAVDVKGSLLFVVNDANGLEILDIGNSTRITVIGTYWCSPGAAVDVVGAGSMAYLAAGNGLEILDIHDPARPRRLGGFPGYASGIAVAGSFVYLAGGSDGFRILDVEDPRSPKLAGTLPGSRGQFVSVSGDRAFLSGSADGLQIVSVADPAHPVILGQDAGVSAYSAVAVQGQLVYTGQPGMRVYDVSDPQAVFRVGSVKTPGGGGAVAVRGGHAYVADGEHGLRVIDVTKPAQAKEVGGVTGYSPAARLVFAGDQLCALFGSAGVDADEVTFRMLDISDPTRPWPSSELATGEPVAAVAFNGNLAFVAAANSGNMRAIDVTNPTAPTLVGTTELEFSSEVAFVGGTLWRSLYDLRAYDPADPAHLIHIANSWIATDEVSQFVAADRRLYVSASAGLKIIDVQEPASPTELGTFPHEFARGAAVSGIHAFMLDRLTGRLLSIDISAPAQPRLVGELAVGSSDSPRLAAAGNRVFVANGRAGVAVVDVTNPTQPRLVGGFDTDNSAVDVAVSGDLLAVADQEGGVCLFRVREATLPVSIEHLAREEYGDLTFRFLSEYGAKYRLEYAETLSGSATWNLRQGSRGTGREITFWDLPRDARSNGRFYRVVKE
jgi:hypothetical protein